MKNIISTLFLVFFLTLFYSCQNKLNEENLNAGWQFYESETYWELYFLNDTAFLFGGDLGQITGIHHKCIVNENQLKIFKYEYLFFDFKLTNFSKKTPTFFNRLTKQNIEFYKIKGTNKIKTETVMDSMLNCYDYRRFYFLTYHVENVLDEFKNTSELDEIRGDCTTITE